MDVKQPRINGDPSKLLQYKKVKTVEQKELTKQPIIITILIP